METYTPCTARQALNFEPMAHSGQNNAVPAMCNMALTTSKINMQVRYEEPSEREDFGYPSDAEWQSKDAPSPIRKGDLEGLGDLGLRPSPPELNSRRAACLEDKIHYHTDVSEAPALVLSAQIKALVSHDKRESCKSGYMATSYEAIPALPKLQDQIKVLG